MTEKKLVLPHDGSGSVPLNQDIEIPRGDGDRIYTFTHDFLASELSVATFTARVKVASEPGTGTVVMSVASDTESAQWDIATDYTATLTLLEADSEGLRQASSELDLEFDIQFILTDTSPVSIVYGDALVQARTDITNDGGTAAWVSWVDRQDVTDLLSQYVAGFDRTFLSAAGTASDTDIDVDDASIFTVGDDIRIILTSGDYDEVEIDAIATNNIDFSTSDPAGLTGAAAIDNVVLKVV